MQFEWDINKSEINLKKHKIDFRLATEVFSDPMAVETTRTINSEVRVQIIGQIADVIISVVYTMRKQNIRLISARKASNKERKIYEQKKPT